MVGQHTGLQTASELCISPCHRDTPLHSTLRQHRNISHHQSFRKNTEAHSMVGAGFDQVLYSSSRRPHFLCDSRRHYRSHMQLPFLSPSAGTCGEIHHKTLVDRKFRKIQSGYTDQIKECDIQIIRISVKLKSYCSFFSQAIFVHIGLAELG